MVECCDRNEEWCGIVWNGVEWHGMVLCEMMCYECERSIAPHAIYRNHVAGALLKSACKMIQWQCSKQNIFLSLTRISIEVTICSHFPC